MSGPQSSSHVGQRHRQDRPKALTADDLNARSLGHAFEAPDDNTRLAQERSYYGSIKSGSNAGSSLDNAIGRATYSFTVGDAGVPHVFTAEMTGGGKIANEKIYRMDDSRHMTEVKLGANVTAQFEQFTLADINNARKTSVDPYVQVHADVSRANNKPRWEQLTNASTKDVQNMLQQQRMPKKSQDSSSPLGKGLY